MVALKHSAMLVTAFALALASGLCQRKTDMAPRLEFEVASIKPSNPNADGGGIKPLPGGQTYVAKNAPVKLMIRLMFHLNNRQISGGPSWLATDLYDVDAKADGPHTIDELHLMFQNLLIDRFKLQFHKEMRTLPAYELVVDKSGPKLKENHSPEHFDIPVTPGGFGKLEATHCSMSYFAWTLSNRLDQPVIDQTGLAQFYDFKLEWTPEPPPGLAGRPDAAANLPPANGPDIFTALREQLGLKLESHKGPVEVMVIDHVERPSEN
ncbi:MAG TPA: TIGR03435 family protein [Candidatus Acidoferrum sp.]